MSHHASKRDMTAFSIMFIGTFFLCISQAMMINALPAILIEFDISAGYGQLITTGYIFALGLISAMTATLVDRFSTKHLCLFSFACFLAGCIIASTAQDFTLLLIGRFLQAGGAGISLPLIQDVALIIYPEEEYGKAMGAVGLIIGFAPAIGPAVAGPIIDLFGWRAIFWILGACVAVIFVLAVLFVHNLAEYRETKFNTPSMVLFCIGFILMMMGLTHIETYGFSDIASWGLLLVGFVVLAFYVRRDLFSSDPMMHLSSFRSRRFTVDCVLVVFAHASMMIASIMVPLYVQGVQGDTATVSGLIVMPGAILLGVLNPVTGRLFDRYGARALSVAGCAFILAGTAAFIACTPETLAWMFTLLYGVRTIGIACLWMPLAADASLALPPQEKTQATAITTSMRQLFSAMFSTVFVSIMAAFSVEPSGISDYGFDISFTILSLFTLGMLVLAFAFVRWNRTEESSRLS